MRLMVVLTMIVTLAASDRAASASPSLVAANNRFSFDLYARLQAAKPDATVVISPISLTLALETAYEGARGPTAAGIASALHLGDLDAASTASGAHALLTALNRGNGSAEISVADALFDRQGFPFVPSFLQTARHDFGARVSALDFASPQALLTINGWVRDQTHGTIPSILPRIDKTAVMYILNAVYFHANWQHPFTAYRDGLFTDAEGTQEEVRYMITADSFTVSSGRGVQAVGLPYEGGRYEMVILLPPEGVSLAHFAAHLTLPEWNRLVTGLRLPVKGTRLDLPRFTVSGAFDLNQALKSMGMAMAFSKRDADFSGVCVTTRFGRCHISQVEHRTYLSVGEQGTTAGAATAVGAATILGVLPPPMVDINRPFVVAIQDRTTGTLLFLGGIGAISRSVATRP